MTFSGPIGGLIDFAIGGGWGSEVPQDKHSRVAVIRGTDIPKVAAGDFSTVPFRFESDKKIVNRLLSPGDVVLETAGGSSANGQYTGRTLLITQEILDALGPAICASFCKKIVLNRELVAPTYFYFYMQDLYSSGRVASYDSQSTGISNFQYEAFVNNELLELPPKEIQLSTGVALQNLNRKINANSQISKTLEDIVQTIFKSWFIDFDPVKAKMAGDSPVGMDDATAALFPDAVEESELGLIPKGWRVRSIGDSVMKQKVGKLFDSKTSFPSGSVPVLDQGKLGVVGFHDEEPGVFASPETPLVVFANHTCSLRLISYPFSVIQNVFPLLGNQVDVIWLYFATEGKQQFDSYKGHWPDFVLHKVIQPTEQATEAFRRTVEPLLKQKWLLEEQSKILGNIRDSLLPRLISGELQIPEEMLAS
jgi:type I restriction enzyme S subunit